MPAPRTAIFTAPPPQHRQRPPPTSGHRFPRPGFTHDAQRLLAVPADSTGIEVTEISHIRVPQLLDSASSVARTRFTRSQLDLLSRENDFSALKQTLVAWCECGFNLVTTAQRLAIHRNTVIYRLDKISRLTARDVREPAVAIALYLACLIDD
jgi:carbohydrate diacid regulator